MFLEPQFGKQYMCCSTLFCLLLGRLSTVIGCILSAGTWQKCFSRRTLPVGRLGQQLLELFKRHVFRKTIKKWQPPDAASLQKDSQTITKDDIRLTDYHQRWFQQPDASIRRLDRTNTQSSSGQNTNQGPPRPLLEVPSPAQWATKEQNPDQNWASASPWHRHGLRARHGDPGTAWPLAHNYLSCDVHTGPPDA